MPKHRIIPTMLWKDVGLVKGRGFDSSRRVGSVLPSIKVYNIREVDELVLFDITATQQGRIPPVDEVELYASECFAPLAIGGGISSVEDIRVMLMAGADKVCINSAAYEHPEIINEAADRFGAQCIVVCIDARKLPDGTYSCFSNCGTADRRVSPVDWAGTMVERGAGEIIITSIERDGTMDGYDLELTKMVSQAVPVPVIASGGAGGYDDFYQALTSAGASACAAASIYHFTQQTPLEAKRYLAQRGVAVRDANAGVIS